MCLFHTHQVCFFSSVLTPNKFKNGRVFEQDLWVQFFISQIQTRDKQARNANATSVPYRLPCTKSVSESKHENTNPWDFEQVTLGAFL